MRIKETPGRKNKQSLRRCVDRRFLKIARRERLSLDSYSFLVDNLYGTVVGYMSIVVAGTVLTGLTFISDPNRTTASLVFAMTIITVFRVVLMFSYRRWRNETLRLGKQKLLAVVRWESTYAIFGILLMGVIGATSAFTVFGASTAQSLAVSVLVTIGIAGCISGRNGSRPTIVSAQIIAVCAPFVFALLVQGTQTSLLVAGMTFIFFAAAMSSTRAQYHSLKTAIINERRAKVLAQSVRRTAMRFDTALNTMSSGLLMFDERLRLVIANDRIKAMWGPIVVEGLVGDDFVSVSRKVAQFMSLPRRDKLRLGRQVSSVMDSGSELGFLLADSKHHRCFGMRLSRTSGGGIVVVVDDVTEKQKQDQEILRLAHQDALTGMANRLDLSRQLASMIDRADVERRSVAMYIDLDGFKSVNDYFGHGVGDRLLIAVAERITDSTRAMDLTARIGGDEFVVCFRDIGDVADISLIANRLLLEITRPYVIDDKTIEIGASAGLALVESADTDPEEVLRLADVALYTAKTTGRGQAVWFTPEMDDRAREHRQMTLELREAIETGALALHYQPITDFRTGRIVCCEALARWTSPTRGIVSPSVFIPLAEESDLIQKLGHWSLNRACEDAQSWPDPSIKVAVNLSPAQFKAGSISRTVIDILATKELLNTRLEIEITESVLAEDLDKMTAELEALNEAGVSIALDDFGAGYSSLGLLHTLPIQKVKLDQSFVRTLDSDPSAIALVSSIVQMANIMRKELVIEGVETAQQLALISQANGRLIQGYYFSRPLPQEALIAYMLAQASFPQAASRALIA